MAVGGVEDLSDELKIAYPSGTFEDPVNKEAPYRVSLNRVELVMRDGIAKFPLGVASAWNVGAVADIGNMPDPIDPIRRQGQVTPELFVGSFQIGIKTKVVAKNKIGTFNSGGIMADRVEGTVADLGKYINRVYAGSTRGRLAVVLTNDGSSQVTLDTPLQSRLLNKNMRIGFWDALTGGAVRGTDGRKITALNRSTHQITYDGGNIAAIAAGDHVFIKDTYGRTFWTLADIVDDGTDTVNIFGLSRTTDPELSAFVLRGSGGRRDLTEQLILDAISAPRQETGKRISRALANDGQGRKYVEFIQAERRYPGPTGGETPVYRLGYDENSLEILAPGVSCKLECEYDCPPRRIYFLAWDTFGRYEAMALDWIDDDSLLKMIPRDGGHKAGFLAYVGSVENQINTMMRANSRLDDLNDPLCGD